MKFDSSHLPLPHGPEARFLTRVLEHSAEVVVAEVSFRKFQNTFVLSPTLDLSEWALEAMAQAAPSLVTSQVRGGVIAKIDSLTIHEPLSPHPDEYVVRVTLLGPADGPLLHVRGELAATPAFDAVLVDAEFKLSLTPAPPAR